MPSSKGSSRPRNQTQVSQHYYLNHLQSPGIGHRILQISMSSWVSFFFLLKTTRIHMEIKDPNLGIILVSCFILSPSSVTYNYLLLFLVLLLFRGLLFSLLSFFQSLILPALLQTVLIPFPRIIPQVTPFKFIFYTAVWVI